MSPVIRFARYQFALNLEQKMVRYAPRVVACYPGEDSLLRAGIRTSVYPTKGNPIVQVAYVSVIGAIAMSVTNASL